jgi:hypothetical protein
MSDLYFKLTGAELYMLYQKRLITLTNFEEIMYSSQNREPKTFNKNMVCAYLNKPQTIWVQSIHFYGGEHFGEPYYYKAEIRHTTTGSAFSRFLNKHDLQFIKIKMPFTY